ncbi:hypothetical protein [Burkholderia ubonensis]|uniref:hypothetical protein n=2 Tax=Burkholderia ubonensis TaxID=101571 RepID=UPI000ACE8EA1|nr:hypothetical protein [Burkholderia ubonensis]
MSFKCLGAIWLVMQPLSCYFCGGVATTREHVPPKGFFPKSERHNLIRVPSCEAHNNEKSGEDEYFRMIVAGAAWDFLPTSLRETIIRSVKRRPLLAAKLIKQSARSDSGAFHYDAELPRVQVALESIGRGLLYHEFGLMLEARPSIIVADFLDLSNATPLHLRDGRYELTQAMCRTLLAELPERGTNQQIFSYKCTEDIVQFKFYGRLLATVAFSDKHG